MRNPKPTGILGKLPRRRPKSKSSPAPAIQWPLGFPPLSPAEQRHMNRLTRRSMAQTAALLAGKPKPKIPLTLLSGKPLSPDEQRQLNELVRLDDRQREEDRRRGAKTREAARRGGKPRGMTAKRDADLLREFNELRRKAPPSVSNSQLAKKLGKPLGIGGRAVVKALARARARPQKVGTKPG
jgi:hypothetical protein